MFLISPQVLLDLLIQSRVVYLELLSLENCEPLNAVEPTASKNSQSSKKDNSKETTQICWSFLCQQNNNNNNNYNNYNALIH